MTTKTEQKYRQIRDTAVELRRMFDGLNAASSKKIVEVCDALLSLYEASILAENQLRAEQSRLVKFNEMVNPHDSEI